MFFKFDLTFIDRSATVSAIVAGLSVAGLLVFIKKAPNTFERFLKRMQYTRKNHRQKLKRRRVNFWDYQREKGSFDNFWGN